MDYVVKDTELTGIADAIRDKGSTTDKLVFPDGFSTAIENIPTGGGGEDNLEKLMKNELTSYKVPDGITTMPPIFAYVDASNLKTLSLNDVKGIETRAFCYANLSGLTTLDLSNKSLANYTFQAAKLNGLTALNLDGATILSNCFSYANFMKLEVLDLSNATFVSSDGNFMNNSFDSLKTIKIQADRCGVIKMTTMNNLTTVELIGDTISNYCLSNCSMKSLETIDLSNITNLKSCYSFLYSATVKSTKTIENIINSFNENVTMSTSNGLFSSVAFSDGTSMNSKQKPPATIKFKLKIKNLGKLFTTYAGGTTFKAFVPSTTAIEGTVSPWGNCLSASEIYTDATEQPEIWTNPYFAMNTNKESFTVHYGVSEAEFDALEDE